MKQYSLPTPLVFWIEEQLKLLNTSLEDSSKIASSVKRMADFYIEYPNSQTPWDESWCKIAQLAYYFPLNFLRNLRVFEELYRINFFPPFLNWYEFGVGLGPSIESFLELKKQILGNSNQPHLKSIHFCEKNIWLQELMQSKIKLKLSTSPTWEEKKFLDIRPSNKIPNFLVFSYSLTELENFPDWIWQADFLLIIEPSTREDGRRLLKFREDALNRNFQVEAPCIHSNPCPLYIHSKKDWCHDRLFFNRPSWMIEIEKHLPFKNPTLTMSYLAIKKKSDTTKLISSIDPSQVNIFRVTGDFLNEKGKTRQLVCRNSEREFLTYLKKSSKVKEFYRGELITINEPIEKKGDELRPQLNKE